MPFSKSDADKHKKGLTDKQKVTWAKIANAVLEKCKSSGGSNCDAKAIKVASAQANQVSNADDVDITAFTQKKIRLKDIKTQESDEGLLVKGVPVFKTGVHHGHNYDIGFIDDKIIKQFDPSEDVPLKADHSDSWNSTLGWVRKIYRKGKMLLADLMLVDDNAITRWNKGLMKKWSVSIDKASGKLHEISAVAFPCVAEASIHGEAAEVGMAIDYEIEEKDVGRPPVKKEVEEIEAREARPDAAPDTRSNDGDETEKHNKEEVGDFVELKDSIDISISSKGTPESTKLSINGKSVSSKDVSFNVFMGIVSLRYVKRSKGDDGVLKSTIFEFRTPQAIMETPIFNEDGDATDFGVWSQKLINTFPDSSFALVKDTSENKLEDRALPYKDAKGNIDPANVRNALARINQVKGFSADAIARAKTLLTNAAQKVGIKVSSEKNKMSETKDLQESTLLKEAGEKQEKMSEEIKTKDTKLTEMSDELKSREAEIAGFKVDAELAELKASGKVLPAQEEDTKAFMLTLDDEARASFIGILNAGKEQVDLKESGSQETKKDETGVDLETMSAEEIEGAIAKYSKDKGIPIDDARDIFYDKHTKKKAE